MNRFAYEFHDTEYPVLIGVKSPDISNAIISRQCVRKGPKAVVVAVDAAPLPLPPPLSVRTVTGVQFMPSAEYAIV
jgi:hypothetical protein